MTEHGRLGRAPAWLRVGVLWAALGATIALEPSLAWQSRIWWLALVLSSTRTSWRGAFCGLCAVGSQATSGVGMVGGFVGLAPLFYFLGRSGSAPGRAGLGFAVGSAMVCLGTPWMVAFVKPPWCALFAAACLAGVLYAGAGLLMGWLLSRRSVLGALACAAVLPLVDHVRTHNEWFTAPYLLVPHAIAGNSLAVQAVEPLGFTLLSYVLCLANLMLARATEPPRREPVLAFAAGLIALHGWGLVRCASWRTGPTDLAVLAIPGVFAGPDRVALRDAATQAFEDPGAHVLLLPEKAIQVPLAQDEADRVRDGFLLPSSFRQGGSRRPVVLAGAAISCPGEPDVETYRNVALVLGTDGRILGARDKLIAAPVGETAAFGGNGALYSFAGLEPAGGCLVSVDAFGPIDTPGLGRTAAAICFEVDCPDIWERKAVGPLSEVSLLWCVSNNSWFDDSPDQLRQDRAARVLHSVESRRPLLYVGSRAADWIDSRGSVSAFAAPDAGRVRSALVERAVEAPWPGLRSLWLRVGLALVVLWWAAWGCRRGPRRPGQRQSQVGGDGFPLGSLLSRLVRRLG